MAATARTALQSPKLLELNDIEAPSPRPVPRQSSEEPALGSSFPVMPFRFPSLYLRTTQYWPAVQGRSTVRRYYRDRTLVRGRNCSQELRLTQARATRCRAVGTKISGAEKENERKTAGEYPRAAHAVPSLSISTHVDLFSTTNADRLNKWLFFRRKSVVSSGNGGALVHGVVQQIQGGNDNGEERQQAGSGKTDQGSEVSTAGGKPQRPAGPLMRAGS